MDDVYDVVIVGAGPAGTAAAIALRKLNPTLSICLLDKRSFPRDKTCGDGLGPGAVRILRELDAMEVIEGFAGPDEVCIAGPGKSEARAGVREVRGVDLSAFVIPRETLDARLLAVAQRRGANFISETTFRSSEVVSGGRMVRITTPNGERELRTRLLIGADGAYSIVRRDLGLARASDDQTLIAVRSYCTLAATTPAAPAKKRWGRARGANSATDITRALRFDFLKELLPAYGWVFPISPTSANVGIGMPMQMFQQRGLHTKELLTYYLSYLESRGYPVTAPENVRSHHLPHGAGLVKLDYPHAVLIGDAASAINPLSGEGIFYGMAAGLMLARELAHWGADAADEHVTRFSTAYHERFAGHFQSCTRAGRLLSSSWRTKAVIKVAARDPQVMDDISLVLFDEQHLKVATMARVARGTVW